MGDIMNIHVFVVNQKTFKQHLKMKHHMNIY